MATINDLIATEADLKRAEAEIERLQEIVRKTQLLATTKSLTIIGYENALAGIRALTNQQLEAHSE